jgi:hippurate hydrolase
MNLITEIEADRVWLERVRRDIHAHPELAYEETRTAGIVRNLLEDWGIKVVTGLAGTGVVGTLTRGSGPRIGLRADMDALPIHEANGFDYRSRHDGRMHACGHDGHTAMLLGAAKYLARTRAFRGTVDFIFQPAEEAAGGARRMIDEGLFERFPVDAVFGMHNWPGLDVGRFAVCTGAMMASLDCFDLVIEGAGTHGALPHKGIDPVVAAAHVVTALQSIVSRNVDPLEVGVVSVTQIHAGDAYNIIPGRVELAGGVRSFDPNVRSTLLQRIESVATSVAAAFDARASLRWGIKFPAVMNRPEETAIAVRAAASVAGAENVETDASPSLGSEDFAYMLEERPGCYLFIGNGSAKGGCVIHNPSYDFNDDILALGASYWVRLTEQFLGKDRNIG